MIRAIIFDVGGVLFRMVNLERKMAWAGLVGMTVEELDRCIFDNPAARRASLGQAGVEEVWDFVARNLSLSAAEVEQLKTDLWQGGVWDQDLLGFLNEVKPRFKLGIISDAWPDARQNIRQYVNEQLFDVLLFSAQEGMTKPAPEIFRRALERLGVEACEAVFVDDDPETIQAAAGLGMTAILYKSSAQVLAELRRACALGVSNEDSGVA